VDILVSELPQLRDLDPKADGVLGQSFLGRSPYLIDYRQKRLWLNEQAVDQADDLPISIRVTRSDGRTMVPVVLEAGARPWHLTLDSGTSHMVLACGDRCPRVSAFRQGNRLTSYTGERTVPLGTLRSVRVAGIKMPPVDAVLMDSPAPEGLDGGVVPANWFSAVFSDGDVVRLRPAR
jgi:hypothetical protein